MGNIPRQEILANQNYGHFKGRTWIVHKKEIEAALKKEIADRHLETHPFIVSPSEYNLFVKYYKNFISSLPTNRKIVVMDYLKDQLTS